MIHPVYRIMCYLFRAGFYELFDGTICGLDNVPSSEPFLLACNHASHFDPPFLGFAIAKRELFAFAKKSLFNFKIWEWIFIRLNSIPVDRNGVDMFAIRTILNLLKNGKCVIIFPEGTRSADGKLGKAHAGVGLFACKSGVQVLPCRIFGTYEIMNRFSHFPNFNERAALVVGKPLDASKYDSKASNTRYQDVADKIMSEIEKLAIPEQNIL
jgi:1-acyl-sn-glycerol-3-phosphate acyltransferase